MKCKFRIFMIICLISGVIINGCFHGFDFAKADVRTDPATNITESSATLNGAVKANGASQTVSFVYYPGDLSGQQLSIEANPPRLSGDSWVKVSADISGLLSGSTCLFYVCASNLTPSCGDLLSFATNYPPDKIFEGGLKFYADSTGNHGLIAAPTDQSIGAEWSNGNLDLLNVTGTILGTGKANTDSIVSKLGSGNYAAKICNDLVLNGYDDWYLPSKDELDTLYKNRILVGGLNPSVFYWSSSESYGGNAWSQHFGAGDQNPNTGKIMNRFNVRAIRTF
jgi:hypothetical protein